MTAPDPSLTITHVHALLVELVRDELADMPPVERLAFFNRCMEGYCQECGEVDDHDVCPCFGAPEGEAS